MPTYTVGDRTAGEQWSLPQGPPGAPPTRPRAVLFLASESQRVGFNRQANVALGPTCTGLHTFGLSNCSAFCILHRPKGRTSWRRASLVHIGGGPEPDAVNWPAMVANMGEGDYYGVLANSVKTSLTAEFCNAALERTPIPRENLWVYDAQTGSINFGLDRTGHAGEVPLPPGTLPDPL